MAEKKTGLAAALLEAHVEYLIDELTGPGLNALIDEEVEAALVMAGKLTLGAVVTRKQIKDTAKIFAAKVEFGPGLPEVVGDIANSIWQIKQLLKNQARWGYVFIYCENVVAENLTAKVEAGARKAQEGRLAVLEAAAAELGAGVHAISNAAYGVEWPKVRSARAVSSQRWPTMTARAFTGGRGVDVRRHARGRDPVDLARRVLARDRRGSGGGRVACLPGWLRACRRISAVWQYHQPRQALFGQVHA
mgnify:CR=1 FL=1